MKKSKNITLWVLQVLAAVAFLGAGFGKLSGQPPMVDMFDKIGLGQWLRFLTGGIEVVAAVLLVIPKWSPVGAILLAATMAGAVVTHLALIGGTVVPPVILLVLVSVIAWGRKEQVKAIFRAQPGQSVAR